MTGRRIALFIVVLVLLGLFLWATVNMTREFEIAGFTTSLEGRAQSQIDNLYIATAKIDGTILKPGEVFSFNEIVGERLRSWGYRGAPTIFMGRMVDTPGGGLCQLSSTLYNAALLSGMDIIERTPHLWKIDSVGPGLDAAIYLEKTGEIDLKFKNPHDLPVKIVCEIQNRRLFVRFISPRELEEKISVEVETLKVYPAPRYPDVPADDGDPMGISSRGTDGYKVRVSRVFSGGGRTARREIVSVDKYEPVPGSLTR